MTRNVKITISYIACGLLVGFFAVATALRAGEMPPPSEADEYRLHAQQILQSRLETSTANDEVWLGLQATEREKILQPIREKAKQESEEMIGAALKAEATATPSDPCPFRGLLYPNREPAVPVPFHSWQFIVLDYWGGVLQGACKGVYAGYDPTNPLQGQLAVYNDPENPDRYDLFPTPTATGPVRIVAEKNGLLTVWSVQGKFDRNTSFDSTASTDDSLSNSVEAPGGAMYVFDLRTLRYR